MGKKKSSRSNSFSFAPFVIGIFACLVVAIAYYFLAHFNNNLRCANSISCIGDLSQKYIPNAEGLFMGKQFSSTYAFKNDADKGVLGENSGRDKHIYIDLTNQRLYADEGNSLIFSFPISSGKWYPTPTGEFKIWIKLRYTRMEGGNPSAGTYYNLPNVPYTMFFYNEKTPKYVGYGIHGAYWHNNFGHPMSHGCVNMNPDDAQKLYEWAEPQTVGVQIDGTPITIFGQTPRE